MDGRCTFFVWLHIVILSSYFWHYSSILISSLSPKLVYYTCHFIFVNKFSNDLRAPCLIITCWNCKYLKLFNCYNQPVGHDFSSHVVRNLTSPKHMSKRSSDSPQNKHTMSMKSVWKALGVKVLSMLVSMCNTLYEM